MAVKYIVLRDGTVQILKDLNETSKNDYLDSISYSEKKENDENKEG